MFNSLVLVFFSNAAVNLAHLSGGVRVHPRSLPKGGEVPARHRRGWRADVGLGRRGTTGAPHPLTQHGWQAHPPLHPALTCLFDWCIFWYNRKSCSWHTLRMRKRAEVENTGKNEATGSRKPKDILGNKVSVKVSKAFRSRVPPLIHSHPAAFSRGDLGGRGFFPQCGNQRGGSLTGFCMQDQFIFYFLFLLATSIQVSKYLFFFFYDFILCRCFIAKLSAALFS